MFKYLFRSASTILIRNMSLEKPIETAILGKVTESLKPTFLNIINESYMHNVKPGSETHFKLVVVSESFDEISSIKRHQMIYKLLSDELKNGVHALSIVAKTPEEWKTFNKDIEASPNCRGGFGK